jgi:hypothetical protein
MANHKHIAKSGDTFNTLAKQYFNDESIGKILASFNKMDSVAALADATEVNIPARLHVMEKTTSENGKPVAHLKVVRAIINVVEKGDSGEIVEEINIRLSGFGGGVPNSTFDDVTELKVKQFQKDYMNMGTPTGMVDEETANAIDEFGQKYPIDFNSIKCDCGSCGGFGKGINKNVYLDNKKDEPHHQYEYPGMHRSLLWAVRGIMLFVANETKGDMKIDYSSGYRCSINNKLKGRTSTNHMGKAIDLFLFKKAGSGWTAGDETAQKNQSDKLRHFFQQRTSAQIGWSLPNKISLEPNNIAPTWVHADVRNMQSSYLKDILFCKNEKDLDGSKMIDLLHKK